VTLADYDFDRGIFDDDDDFESDDLEDIEASDHSYLKGMWSGFRATSNATFDEGVGSQLAQDTILAHGMVQSFVNAFARDGYYVVTFDPHTSTAGTDMHAKHVAITPAPIADKDLTAEEAGLILTGLATHEISHPRYGRRTAQAVDAAFPGNGTASRLSNLLDDIRIEKRFIADYPGYAGIFEPTLNYVGAASLKRDKILGLRKPSLNAPVNLAIGATRYPSFNDWSDPAIKAEFDWWNDWAVRGSREDAPIRHVGFIREALQHIAALKAQQKKAQSTTAPSASSSSSGTGDSDPSPSTPSGGEKSEAAPLDDDTLNQITMPANYYDPEDTKTEDDTNPMDGCSGSAAVDKAAAEGDTTYKEIAALKNEAENIVQNARNQESDGHGNKVDVSKSLRGITGGLPKARPSAVAAKYIRNAIMQSRTGHTDHAPFKRHGRLDQRGIARIAKGDYRVFEKRTAPSVGRFNIWVMVDASSSMEWGGWSEQAPLQNAAAVGHAMAVASQTIPTVRMSLWAWSSPFRSGAYADGGAALAWKTGMKTDQALRLSTVKTGGTPDAVVMGWAGRAILKETVGEETPVIIFISDGAGYGEMNARIEEARKAGVEVYGVSFSGGMDDVDSRRFGKNNYVPWKGSIEETARPLATLFARITGMAR
jgi:hypothetical protein